MMNSRWWLPLALAFGLSVFARGKGTDLYFVDAHGQIDETVDYRAAIRLMDRADIRRVILTPVGSRRPRDIVQYSRQFPGRILPSVRTKLPAYLENAGDLDGALHRQAESGNFRAIAELLLY